MPASESTRLLTGEQIAQFIRDGFVRIDPLQLDRANNDYSPVELAIRQALQECGTTHC
jgi:hypothetical protein